MSDTVRPIDGGLGAAAKRGRPRKDGTSPGVSDGNQNTPAGISVATERVEGTSEGGAPRFAIIDPLDIPPDAGGGDGGGDSGARKRGRPRGKRPKEEAVSNLSELLKVERLLVTACFFLGNIASAPELYCSPEEAKEVSEAFAEFAKHHSVGLTEKRISEVNLAFAVAGVFGPKVVVLWRRPKASGPRRVADIRPIQAEQPTAAGASANGKVEPLTQWPNSGDIEGE
jgi:hypothetical protein